MSKMFERKQAVYMGKLIKLLFFLLVFGFIALIAYAYLGPFFGANFAPDQIEVREPVQLPVQ
jgi:uncharacterized membrane protein (DUF485 family)